jgi:hypothetical protein
MLSKDIDECMLKVENTLLERFRELIDPCELENLIVGINMELTQAWSLGVKEGLKMARGEDK